MFGPRPAALPRLQVSGHEPAGPDAGFLIRPSLCVFRKCLSLRLFEKRGIPAQTNPNEVGLGGGRACSAYWWGLGRGSDARQPLAGGSSSPDL